MRTLDQIIAEARGPAELERLLRRRAEWDAALEIVMRRREAREASIPAPPDAPGEEAAARRDRT